MFTPFTKPTQVRAGRGRSGCARRGGFSLIELVVVLLIITILMAFLLPAITKARRAAQGAACLSNLRQIAVGFHLYASDNGGKLPDPGAGDVAWEDMLAPYLRVPEIYQCASDGEVFQSVGSSYDWRDTGDPDTTLAGQPISDAKARNCVLVFDSLPNWHARGKMNVGWTDTSASAVDVEVGLKDLMNVVKAEKQKGKGKGNNPNKGKRV